MRRIKEDFEEKELEEKQWDLKRIIIGIIILLSLLLVGFLMLSKADISNEKPKEGALGISSRQNQEEKAPSLPTREDVEKIIVEAKNNLSNITSENLTSSQAAIQKVIADLKTLQGKKEPVDIFCELVCKNR